MASVDLNSRAAGPTVQVRIEPSTTERSSGLNATRMERAHKVDATKTHQFEFATSDLAIVGGIFRPLISR